MVLETSDPARRTTLYIKLRRAWDKEASVVWIGNPTLSHSGKDVDSPLAPDRRYAALPELPLHMRVRAVRPADAER